MQALDVPTLISPAPKAPASHLSDLRFDTLPLHPVLLDNLRRLGYSHCTPIQAQTLPRALAGEDLAGQAQTGTGKTAAFLLALLNHLLTRPSAAHLPRALVLAPTRELALQIYNDALALTVDTSVRLVAVYGGTGYETQRSSIETGAEVLIGTPGRLIDFFKQGVFTLKGIEVLVLDEADRMFDLGFIADIRYLMRRMPPPAQRRNYLFSATLSHRVLELAYEHMNNPTRVEIEPEQVTAERVTQSLIHVANDEKLRLLVGLLRRQDGLDPGGRTMVFVNTKRVAEQVEATLNGNRLQAATLSGDVPQNKRERLLEEFRSGALPILVATDVAARGLHISDVSCVINYDLPQDAQDYVHRIGRTARAGASGDAISMCCETYVYSLPDIEALIGQRIPAFADVDAVMPTDFVVVKVARSAESRSGARPHRGGSRPPQRRR